MSRYTVIDNRGCKVIEGSVPVTEFVALTRVWTERDPEGTWIVDAVLAHALNANFVVGPKAACEAWRKELGLDARSGPPRPEPEPVDVNPQASAENAPGAAKSPTYTIIRQGRAIWCHKCDMTSYNSNDVRERYCANCGYHE